MRRARENAILARVRVASERDAPRTKPVSSRAAGERYQRAGRVFINANSVLLGHRARPPGMPTLTLSLSLSLSLTHTHTHTAELTEHTAFLTPGAAPPSESRGNCTLSPPLSLTPMCKTLAQGTGKCKCQGHCFGGSWLGPRICTSAPRARGRQHFWAPDTRSGAL